MQLPTLLRKQNVIMCPKCLTRLKVTEDLKECPVLLPNGETCGYQFPSRYLQNAHYAEPFFVQVFGWTQHGKTVFLDALRLMLLDMGKFWPGYTHQSLTELDMSHEKVLRASLKNGVMPKPTDIRSRDQNEVYIMQLDNMPRWGSRSLVIMDHAGERFARFDVPADEMPFLVRTLTTFMLISIPRIKEIGQGEAMDQLLNIYIETMTKNKVNFRKENRKLVIVLTMADLIEELPPHLRQYLVTDDHWSMMRGKERPQPMDLAEMQAYLERMQWVSDEIKDWLSSDGDGAPGGANLVGLIKNYNIDARYTLISATGSTPTGETQIHPYRVLDPFFWALEFQSR